MNLKLPALYHKIGQTLAFHILSSISHSGKWDKGNSHLSFLCSFRTLTSVCYFLSHWCSPISSMPMSSIQLYLLHVSLYMNCRLLVAIGDAVLPPLLLYFGSHVMTLLSFQFCWSLNLIFFFFFFSKYCYFLKLTVKYNFIWIILKVMNDVKGRCLTNYYRVWLGEWTFREWKGRWYSSTTHGIYNIK